MTRVRFYYDVVCPYSYMESDVMEAAEIFYGQSTHAYRPRRR